MFSEVAQLSFEDGRQGWLRTRGMELADTGIGLWRVESSGHLIELTAPQSATVLIPLRGSVVVETSLGEWSSTHGAPLFLHPGERRTRTLRHGGESYCANAVLCPAPRDLETGPGRGVVLADPDFAMLIGYLAAQMASPGSPLSRPDVQRAAATLIREHLAGLLQGSGTEPADAGPAAVRRAEEIMRERLGEPLAIRELACSVGVGPRALQAAFRRYRGVAPREFLNRLRLEAARARLLSAGPAENVSSVALDSGFTHLGRFSVAYRKTFGETPSQTRKRRR